MLILASGSKQRLELLRQLGFEPELVVVPDVDERPLRDELPAQTVARLARAKAARVAELYPQAVVVAADTGIACGRRLLAKPKSTDQAYHCLSLLSGRRHRVHTGVVVRATGRVAARLVQTRVAFKRLDRGELIAYLASGEWHGKAGGYAIQGRAAAFVRWLGGSYSSVVGLPLYETAALLRGFGLIAPTFSNDSSEQ